jgi:MOSC domain-containing protein YiiM
MSLKAGRVLQISVSQGGVPKLPIAAAELTAGGVGGDAQRFPDIHGGPERAVCLFAVEVIRHLQREGHPVVPGALGENLTTEGLEWARVEAGTYLLVADAALLQITRPAAPCKTIAACFTDGNFSRISHLRHPGESRVYARVLAPGPVATGDPIRLMTAAEAEAHLARHVAPAG